MSDSDIKEPHQKRPCVDHIEEDKAKLINCEGPPMESSQSKSPPVIGTHNGTFHCDEVFACYMLKLLPEYQTATIVRTRDPKLLSECDIVVDVGGIYDPTIDRYDHHQRTFNESMSTLTKDPKTWTTKLSSAGLIYLHFGKRVLSIITGASDVEELYDVIYSNFVEEIDGVDNGIEEREGVPKYAVKSTIGHRVARLNPAWNDPDQETDMKFQTAMQIVGEEFKANVFYYNNAWLPAKTMVQSALEKRFEVDESGEIIKLDQFCPWSEHLFVLESNLTIHTNIKFVLYPETGTKKWRVQAVPIHKGSFNLRLPLLEQWRGLRDDQLSELSNIIGCIFVHSNGFIGGNLTYDGVLKMAKKTLLASKEK